MRDSKQLRADGTCEDILWESADGWDEFLEAVSAGRPATSGLSYEVVETGDVHVRSESDDITLTFDNDEWVAFRSGIDNGEFRSK